MSKTAWLWKFMKDASSCVVHFAHGGLLAAGFLVTAFMLMYVGSAESHERGLQELGDLFSDGRTSKASSSPAAEQAVSPSGARPAIEYLSRKYRVAASAIEPLVLAAQVAGERAGLEPMLIVAVIAIESGFNPIAESPLGAQGLMQVIPRFHQDKIDGVGGNGLLDPVQNIQVGALVLKESIRRAGSLEAGLQQYAGAVSDDEGLYAAKVLAEKQRIEAAVRRARNGSA